MSARQEKVEQSTKPSPWYFDPVDPRLTEVERDRAEKVVQKYRDEKKKLFPRDVLQNIETILASHEAGNPGVNLSLGLQGNTLARLDCVPVQRLMNPYWYEGSKQTDGQISKLPNPIGIKFHSYNPLREASIDNLKSRWNCEYADWLKADARARVLKAFEKVPPEKFEAIEKVIAFGIGSLWRSYSGNFDDGLRFKGLRDRARQHALIKDIQDFVSEKTGKEVKAYVQDPRYTLEDVPFLQRLGLEQLEEPKGFLEVDEHTLVYSIKARIPVMQILADTIETKPAMILWRDFLELKPAWTPDENDDLAVRSDPISPNVKQLLGN